MPDVDHPDAELACDAIKMANAVRGGKNAIDGVIFTPIINKPVQRFRPHSVGERSDDRSDKLVIASITLPRGLSSPPWNTSALAAPLATEAKGSHMITPLV